MILHVGAISLRAAVRTALRSGGIIALMGLSSTVLAEPSAPCFTQSTLAKIDNVNELALPKTINRCIRDVHEGRAAVLLPIESMSAGAGASGENIQQQHWGFLDAQGQLVIKPVFSQVGDFHFAAAAAEQDGKWGYIDPTGNWLIKPMFDKVGRFTESGLAVAILNGKIQLIDRKGAQVGEPLDELVDTAVLSDGEPARLRLDYKTVLLSPDEKRHVASDKMEILQPFGGNNLFIARDAQGFGIADQNLGWQLAPHFKNIQLDPLNSQLALATSEEGITLIRSDGTLDTQKYSAVKAVTPTFWLATTTDAVKLLDNTGAVVSSFNAEVASSLLYQGDYALLSQTKEQTAVYVPGRKTPLELPAGSQPWKQDIGHFLVTTKGDDQKVNAIIAPSGGMIGGTQNVGWLSQIAEAEAIKGRLWLKNSQGQVINIVDGTGKALFNQKSTTALEGYRLAPLDSTALDAAAPIALIRPSDASAKAGAGFVRADGSLQLDSKWLDIQSAASDNTVSSLSNQYIVKTAQGTGIVDEQGKILIPLAEDNISPFSQGYALNYLNGKLTALDAGGKHYDLPNAFEFESMGNGWFRYRETAAEGALWGIYNVLAQTVVSQPAYQNVGTYSNQQAEVQLPNGRWGLIDHSGAVVVDAKYAKVERINAGLWLLTESSVTDQPDAAILAEVVGADAKPRIAPTAGLQVTQFSDGRILATATNGQSWLLDAKGNVELHEQQTKISALGDWVKLSRQPQEGYVSPLGAWQIPPLNAVQSSAFAKNRALRETEQGTELIDNQGARVAPLPAGKWQMSLSSGMAISYEPQDDVATTRYVDSTGKLVLTVQGKASAIVNGRAVLTRDDHAKVWIDEKGNTVPDVMYSDLGLLSNDLAFAQVENHYGFINAQGHFIIPPVFDAVSPFDNGVSIVSTEDSSMMIDSSGKPLARVDNECGIHVLYGAGSTRQWPQTMPENCQPLSENLNK